MSPRGGSCPLMEQLSVYLDAELDVDDGEHMRQHLLECAYCQQRFRRLQRLRGFCVGMAREWQGDASESLERFFLQKTKPQRCLMTCSMLRRMLREMGLVCLALAASGVFFISGRLLSQRVQPQAKVSSVSYPLARESHEVSPPLHLADLQHHLQTMEASFEVTLPGNFPLPLAGKVSEHVGRQFKKG